MPNNPTPTTSPNAYTSLPKRLYLLTQTLIPPHPNAYTSSPNSYNSLPNSYSSPIPLRHPPSLARRLQ